MLKLTLFSALLILPSATHFALAKNVGYKTEGLPLEDDECYCNYHGSHAHLEEHLECKLQGFRCIDGCVEMGDACFKTWVVGVVAGSAALGFIILVTIMIICCCTTR